MVALRPVAVRYGAPVAFLVAATIAVLLVRSTVDDEPAGRPDRPAVTTAAPAAARPAATRAKPGTRSSVAQEHYEIRAGDTLGSVADRYDTTVEALVGLNPGIDPTGLQVGQRIRVK